MKQANEPSKKKVRTLCVKVTDATYKKIRYMAVARDQNNSEVVADAIDDLASATGLGQP
jgi:predicted transcriptional regulator